MAFYYPELAKQKINHIFGFKRNRRDDNFASTLIHADPIQENTMFNADLHILRYFFHSEECREANLENRKKSRRKKQPYEINATGEEVIYSFDMREYYAVTHDELTRESQWPDSKPVSDQPIDVNRIIRFEYCDGLVPDRDILQEAMASTRREFDPPYRISEEEEKAALAAHDRFISEGFETGRFHANEPNPRVSAFQRGQSDHNLKI
jgi:hypothetical protein